MTLKEMWEKYLELWDEGDKLYDEGNKLWGEKDDRLWGRYIKLWEAGEDLWDKAEKLLCDFSHENYGIEIWIRHEDDRIIFSNGVILYYDGRIHEPLEIVMKKIIKEYEEGRDDK